MMTVNNTYHNLLANKFVIFVKKICEEDTIGGHFMVELYYFYRRHKRKHELKLRFFTIFHNTLWISMEIATEAFNESAVP